MEIPPSNQQIVEIVEVMALMLNVPGHQIRRREATLKDWGSSIQDVGS